MRIAHKNDQWYINGTRVDDPAVSDEVIDGWGNWLYDNREPALEELYQLVLQRQYAALPVVSIVNSKHRDIKLEFPGFVSAKLVATGEWKYC